MNAKSIQPGRFSLTRTHNERGGNSALLTLGADEPPAEQGTPVSFSDLPDFLSAFLEFGGE